MLHCTDSQSHGETAHTGKRIPQQNNTMSRYKAHLISPKELGHRNIDTLPEETPLQLQPSPGPCTDGFSPRSTRVCLTNSVPVLLLPFVLYFYHPHCTGLSPQFPHSITHPRLDRLMSGPSLSTIRRSWSKGQPYLVSL